MLGEIVDDLKKNPMLALFQAGNELVHSNLLAWILEYNNDQLISKKLKEEILLRLGRKEQVIVLFISTIST